MYILAGSKEASVESTGESTEVQQDTASVKDADGLSRLVGPWLKETVIDLQTDFEAAARDAKRRRIHDAEMAWVQVRLILQSLHQASLAAAPIAKEPTQS